MSSLLHKLIKRGLPVGLCIALLLVILVAALTLLHMLNTQREGNNTAAAAADHIFSLTFSKVELGITTEIMPVLSSISVAADFVQEQGVTNIQQATQQLLPASVNILKAQENTLAINYAYHDGTFFSVTAMRNDTVRQGYKASPACAYVIWSVIPDPEHPKNYLEYWEYLDTNLTSLSTRTKAQSYDPRTRAWYTMAIGTSELVMTKPYIFTTSRELGLACSQRMLHGKGVLAINIMVKNFEDILDKATFSPHGQLLLIDRQQRIIASRLPLQQNGNEEPQSYALEDSKKISDPVLQSLLRNRENSSPSDKVPFRESVEGKEYFAQIASVHLGRSDLLLLAYAPQDDFLPFSRHFFRNMTLFSLGILVLFLPLAIVLARYMSQPLAQLIKEIQNIKNLDLARTPQVSTWIYEVRRLYRAFALMKNTIRRQRVTVLHHKRTLESTVQERTKELSLACNRAEAATTAKSAFLAMMSHEIRTPISGIIGMAQLCLETQTTAQQKHYLDRILFAATNLVGIVNDALDFSKIEAGKLTIEKEAFNLHELIHNIEQSLITAVHSKKLELHIIIANDVPMWIEGDSLRLAQVLHNLFSNAIKFTEQGCVKLHIIRSIQDQQDMLVFTMQDTGIGLSPEEQSRLFTPYEQAEKSTARRFGGTGLGLNISRSLVHLMGGEILVKSKKGVGSEFSFCIPLHMADSMHQHNTATEECLPETLWGMRILLVEDDEINQEIAKTLLESLHMDVDVAPNGQEACTLVAQAQKTQKPYKLVFMDVQMPVMDGITATKHLRAQGFTLPIVALSANATQTDTNDSLAAGMQDHISKPFSRETLILALRQWLRSA